VIPTGVRRRTRRDWLAGLVVGVAAGFWFAEWPTLGALIAVAFAVPAALSRTRPAALGGLLIGIPAMWLTVIGLATARCAEFDAQSGQSCVMADVEPWLAIAAGLLALGALMSLAAAGRR
jgi:hypothetical protein